MPNIVKNLVSTVIPVYNRSAMLKSAVSSVLQQTWRPIEVIIVDDGSNDDTLQAANELKQQYPDIVHVISIPNSGPGPAREAGRQMAQGEFIQYLDSDDRLLPEKFAIQVEALRRQPECDIAYGQTRLINAEGFVQRSPFKWTGRELPHLFPALLLDRWWCTHTPLYRRTLTDSIGPWSGLRFSQDWEYDARAGALGARLVYCPVDVSEHQAHDGIRQTGSGKWLIPKDRVLFFKLLESAARQAGVNRGAPEWHHFSRWVFAQARMCGKLGDPAAAQSLLRLSISADTGSAFDQRLFGLLVKCIGWQRLVDWSEAAQSVLGKRHSPYTLKQSWMESADEKT